ncbi:hypothetical protein [Helicobacter sp. T3_23-1059]
MPLFQGRGLLTIQVNRHCERAKASVAIYHSSKVDCHALDSAKMQNLIVLQSQQNHKNLITMQLNFPS